ncbi:MAG: DNA repair protein RecN [Actinomycetia bacterium]|nr:DNA repair protein RecN [Actinomycetes bacterium]
MLEELHIRDLALIEEAWLPFEAGLTVLSGETGAGKTMLINALQLVMGGRGDAQMIRPGAASLQVEAQFSGELVASRTLAVSGRNRCLLEGSLSTVGALAERIGPCVDLHGQHDHQELLHPANHLSYLDRSAAESIAPLLEDYRSARATWQAARDAAEALSAQLTQSAEQLEAGRIALAEIQRVDPQPAEDEDIRASLPALENAEELAELTQLAYDALNAEGAVLDTLARAREALDQARRFDPALSEQQAQIEEATILLSDVADSLRDALAHIEHDPLALQARLDRLAELDGLAKRFGPTLTQVFALRERLAATAAVTENGQEAQEAAQAALTQARASLEEAARALADERRRQAALFCRRLAEAAAPLQLGSVRFDFALADLPFEQWTARGPQRLEILYAPTPESELRPLARIASGGEISRVMLALQTVLGAQTQARTLIFDEIDAGIGGAVATAIGRALKELSRHHQVIVVTHLAQVAAFGDAHFVVRKQESATTVTPVTGQHRTEEIARMLAGEVSEAALAHAAEVLASAGS